MANPLPTSRSVEPVTAPTLLPGATAQRRGLSEPDRHQLLRYGALSVGVLIAAIGLILFAREVRSDDPTSTAIARRELRLNTLKAGEQAFWVIPVFRRSAIDYFRATRGLLVLTNRRLLYLGLRPHELFVPPDAPPTFETQDFALDSLIRMRPASRFLGIGRAASIHSSGGSIRLDLPFNAWNKAGLLAVAVEVRRQRALELGTRLRQLASRAEDERRAAEANARKPQYYTIQRGDALGSVATRWNTTPDSLRAWNHLPNNKIR